MKSNIISKAGIAALTTATLAGFAAQTRAAEPSKPNVIFIISDQMTIDMIHALSGNPYVSTPNLDRLANRGFAYTRNYVANPVCGPSRFAMFTGHSTVEYGIRDNGTGIRDKIIPLAQTRSMGALFKNAGYDTYYGGKTHLAFGSSTKNSDPNGTNLENYAFTDITPNGRDELSVVGAKFLAEHKSPDNKPFLLVLSYINPHDICAEAGFLRNTDPKHLEAMRKQAQSYPAVKKDEFDTLELMHAQADKNPPDFWQSDKSAKLPLNMTAPKDNAVAQKRAKGDEPLAANNNAGWRRYTWVYYRLTELVDRHIGVVLDALDKSPYKDNTIIVFTSDHGELNGSHGLRGKTILYEECQRTPYIFVGPGIRHGTDDTIVCNGWDMIPTLCDIASTPAPDGLTGVSLYPNMTKGAPVPQRKYLYLESTPGLQIIADSRYKYSLYDTQTPQYEMLFDIKTDPGELKNLINDSNYKTLADDLRAQLKKEAGQRNISLAPQTAATKAKGKAKAAGKGKAALKAATNDNDNE